MCWGAGGRGQLGYGNEMSGIGGPLSVEVDVINEKLVSIIQISAGHTHTCALHFDGTGYCWGKKDGGRLTLSGIGSMAYPLRIVRLM